jgi:NAD(P)-dependent dehydrogenase (short-subunit alcohol dehydrogenase family)
LDSITLKGHVAAVTGGGRGIGRATAQALAAAGASVAVLARSTDQLAETVTLIKEAGGKSQAFPLDVTDAPAVRAAFAEIESALGPVDLLVNNAADGGPIGPLWETKVVDWWRAVEVNLRGPLLCTSAVLPGMIARRRGRIINVSSGAGAFPIPYLSSYVVAKTALIRFSENLAAETRPHGIAVFAIAPGTVRTAMADVALESSEGRKWLPWFKRLVDEGFTVPAERPAQFILELAAGSADLLSGRFLTIQDDLGALLGAASEIEKENLYSLRVRRLSEQKSSPALEAIRTAAEGRDG